VPAICDIAFRFSTGIAFVTLNGKVGFINTRETTLIRDLNDLAGSLSDLQIVDFSAGDSKILKVACGASNV
jgi:hypothetical protein